MAGFTKPLNTANGFANLGTLMRAAGYGGSSIVSSLIIFNPHATNLIYVHVTSDGITAPTTSGDGMPYGAGATAVGNAFYSDRGSNQASLDINTTWISAAAVFEIKVMAVGT